MKLRAAAALIVLIAAAMFIPLDVGRTFGIKGDEATYVSMALSVAYDGDLKYRPEDLRRFQGLYGIGPEGLFLKQGSRLGVHVGAKWPPVTIVKTPSDAREGLDFGKPFAYSVAAAPFVRIAGLRGLVLFNALLLLMVVGMGWRFASRRMGVASAGFLTAAFVLASVTILYAFWLTSEIFNFAIVFAAFFLWLYKEVALPDELQRTPWLRSVWTDVAAAALLGLATYSKPPNALLIAPLVLTLLWRRQWRRSVLVCAAFLLLSGGTFAINALITGDANYQGGNRRTFYGRFPYSDPEATFDRIGERMATEDPDAESLFAPHVLLPLLKHNLVYFFIGRHAGLVPYFLPGVVILLMWLARPRSWTLWQVLCALALAASVLVVLVLVPYSWGGGGGAPGNRYFLSLYPVLFFLIPDRPPRWPVVVSLLGLLVTAPLVRHPIAASKQPWRFVGLGMLRALPVELTMVDDLPVRLGPRGRIPFGPDPKALVYLVDEDTFSPEGDGFWVAGGAKTDIIVRTERALDRVKFLVRSGVPNHVSLSMGAGRASIDLQPGEIATITMHVGPGVVYTHGSHAYVLSISTANGFVPREVEASSTDDRFLGVFVRPDFTQLESRPIRNGG
jgi:hypothetical protein